MAINAEQLNIILSAQTADLRRELERAQRRIQDFERRSRSDLGRTSRHFDTLGAAAKRLAPILTAAFSVQAIANMTRSAAEIGRLADVAGVSAEELQLFAAGAKTAGFEIDKVADVIKDVNDKVGDFLQTGGGPMADFFENIAPKVGVTADQFARLSGPEALQLYVNSLEAANLSQSEMTFYMEAIANDATALLPLLQDNGKAMKDLGDEALRSGRILDQDAIDGARDLGREMGELSDTIKKQLTAAVLDNKDELLALVEFISGTVVPAVSGLITTITNGVEAYNRLRGIDTSAVAVPSEEEAARLQEDVARRPGEGDASGTGLYYVDPATGEVRSFGDDNEAPIPGVTAPSPVSVPPADMPLTDDTTGGSSGDPLADLRKSLEEASVLLEEFRLSETEAQIIEYENRQALLDEALQAELLTQEEYNRLKLDNEQKHVEDMARLAQEERSARLGQLSSMFSELAGVAEAGGEKMLKVQAGLSAAAALIAAYETASKAAAEATGGIPGRIAAYAAFLAQGMQAVQAIQSIGASGSASAGGGTSTATAATAEQPSTSSAVAIQLTGGDMFSRDQVVDLINAINEAVEDGATVRLV